MTPKEFFDKARAELGDKVAFATVAYSYGGGYFGGEIHEHPIRFYLSGTEIDGNGADTPEQSIENVRQKLAEKDEYEQFKAWKASKGSAEQCPATPPNN